jgi:predicted amidohydrolase
MILATTQYPITRFATFDDWAAHTGQWVSEAAQQGAALVLFPEYGAMELASLLSPEEQADLHLQIKGLGRWLPDFLEVYASLARRHQLILVAPSFPVAEGARNLNRAHVFSPQKGLAAYQDKWMMTRFEQESWFIQAPEQPEWALFEADWGAFGIQICYDVEFAHGALALSREGANLILAPSCTETVRGATRVHVGARARALENQCYVAVSQTVGNAPWSPAVDINYGFAAIYGPPDVGFPEDGILAQRPPQVPEILIQKIDFEKIMYVRKEGQVLNYRDHHQINHYRDVAPVPVKKYRVS